MRTINLYVVHSITGSGLQCSRKSDNNTCNPLPERKLVWSDEFHHSGYLIAPNGGMNPGVRNQEPQYYTTKRVENCGRNGML